MSRIHISPGADKLLKEYLIKEGHTLCEVHPASHVEPSIACHPDIYMCNMGDGIFFGDPSEPGDSYPANAIYNACSTGKFFIHNIKITAPELLEAARFRNQITVHVAQGYAKCSCVVLDENSIITADGGIIRAAAAKGMDVLAVEPKQVVLEGYPYGFIGGASGRVGNSIIFNGNIKAHSDYERIKDFIARRGLDMIYFEQFPLTDIGSVIEEKISESGEATK